jgi:hypothetical protein
MTANPKSICLLLVLTFSTIATVPSVLSQRNELAQGPMAFEVPPSRSRIRMAALLVFSERETSFTLTTPR